MNINYIHICISIRFQGFLARFLVLEFGNEAKPSINCVWFISLWQGFTLFDSFLISTLLCLAPRAFFRLCTSAFRIHSLASVLLSQYSEGCQTNRIIAANTIEVCNSFVEAKCLRFFYLFSVTRFGQEAYISFRMTLAPASLASFF